MADSVIPKLRKDSFEKLFGEIPTAETAFEQNPLQLPGAKIPVYGDGFQAEGIWFVIQAPAHGANHPDTAVAGGLIDAVGPVASHGGEHPRRGTGRALQNFAGKGKILNQFSFGQKIQSPMEMAMEAEHMTGAAHRLHVFGG